MARCLLPFSIVCIIILEGSGQVMFQTRFVPIKAPWGGSCERMVHFFFVVNSEPARIV